MVFRTVPKGQAQGKAVLASEGDKVLVGMSFPSPVYPREQLGYNGSSFMASFVTAGVRSFLGSFLMTHSLIFKQGLMGGALSSAWPLQDVSRSGARLEYAGQKTENKHLLHELKYTPRGSTDLHISLFFDSETFQHVRTEYTRVIPAETGTRAYANVAEREVRYKMVEEFSDFKKESRLTLPHTYEISLTVDSQNGTFAAEWVLKLTQFTFNEKIDPAAFDVSAD